MGASQAAIQPETALPGKSDTSKANMALTDKPREKEPWFLIITTFPSGDSTPM